MSKHNNTIKEITFAPASNNGFAAYVGNRLIGAGVWQEISNQFELHCYITGAEENGTYPDAEGAKHTIQLYWDSFILNISKQQAWAEVVSENS